MLAAGGSVYFRYTSVTALSVLLPADSVSTEIAARAEVQSISPNRMTARTASTVTTSLLEQATGATGVRTPHRRTGYSGLDGTGVGIAVLDSGVDVQAPAVQRRRRATRA